MTLVDPELSLTPNYLIRRALLSPPFAGMLGRSAHHLAADIAELGGDL